MPAPRTTTKLKLLMGTRPDRITEDTTPVPSAREPQPLPWFTPHQHEIWAHVVTELRDMRLLSAADQYEIAAYVVVVSHFEAVARQMNTLVALTDEDPYVVELESKPNVFKVAPNAVLLNTFATRLSLLGAKLGLSPQARTAIHGRGGLTAASDDASTPWAS